MVSIASLLNIAANQEQSIGFLPQRCLRKRLNTNSCSICLAVCRSDALSLKGRDIVLDSSSCTQCMKCITACPQDVFVSTFDHLEMLTELKHRSIARVTCERKRSLGQEEVSVPCLGIISKPLLTAIGLSGCRKVQFDISGCSACENHHAVKQFGQIHKKTTDAFSDIFITELEVTEITAKKEDPGRARRKYLSHLKKTVTRSSRDSLSFSKAPPIPGKQNHRIIPEKVKLIQELLANADEISRTKIALFFHYNLSVNENCDSCPLCKGICPTGAITIQRLEGEKRLQYESYNCSGCGLCVDFCKKDALTLTKKG